MLPTNRKTWAGLMAVAILGVFTIVVLMRESVAAKFEASRALTGAGPGRSG